MTIDSQANIDYYSYMKKLNKVESRRLIRELVKKSGSYAVLAQLVEPGISRQAVNNWYRLGIIPEKRVKKLLSIKNRFGE